jgi:hypothetical protein
MLAEMNQTRPSSSKGALSSVRTPSVKRVARSELVAAEAGRDVAQTQADRNPSGDLGEDTVALRVAERLVDHLEPVDVEEDHRHRRGLVRRGVRHEGVLDPPQEDLASGQPGHGVDRIVAGRLLEPGVLEGDRGELGEPVHGVDLGLVPGPIGRSRGEADDPDDVVARGQGHAEDGTDLGAIENR